MAEEIKFIKDEKAFDGSIENEEIIELTDEIADTPQNNNDDIIELVDEVVAAERTKPADSADRAAQDEPDIAAASETVVETEKPWASETASAPFLNSMEEIRISDDIEDETDLDESGQDDFVNSLGMDLETDSAFHRLAEDNGPAAKSAPAETAATVSEVISPDQIEAAVERIILKIFSEKIDRVLSDAIEKTLTREIDKIKAILLENSSDNNL